MDKINFLKMYSNYISNYWPNISLTYKEKLSNESKNNLKNNFLSSHFISQDISNKFQKLINISSIKKYTYQINLPQGRVNFHFCSDKTSTFINNLAKYYFFVVFLRLNYNNKYNKTKFSENIYINIIPLPISKTLSNPITIDNINSASTLIYPDYYGGPIFIWRLDEIEKVLIHEALHSMHYDVDIINMDLIEDISVGVRRIHILWPIPTKTIKGMQQL